MHRRLRRWCESGVIERISWHQAADHENPHHCRCRGEGCGSFSDARTKGRHHRNRVIAR
ncbi:hypothetical protein CSR02_14825 [Acetobacter pomorum]|uniref:Uncharacterized protein n=1 Tax=Acetobacter pomorum TaxID=65959 RepID=A0A2G4RAM5_9PROT|nr:hypothetical protein CSR02_14825 [Acetobacter pomorum]